jgi:Putative metal-binding motif
MFTAILRVTTTTLALGILILGCGDNSTNNGQPDASTYCENETDCPTGYQCVGNQCVARDDAGTVDAEVSPGEISVFPDPLQFGFAPLLIDTMLDVTVVNVGLGPLTITQIEVVETDLVDEYSANPVGPVDIVLGPADQTTIQVTLRPEDGELDFGTLEVTSDDPDNPVVSVALESDYKGLAALEACTLDDATPNPVPFEDCQVDTLNGDPILEYGVVTFGVPAVKIVAIRNGADTNAPLQVDDIVVQSTSSTILAEFSVRMFAYDTDGVTEIPVTFPSFLRAEDPANGIVADVIYAEVTFGANFDGIVTETSLVITSSDPNVNPIPISAAVTGCPQDYWDLNDDPSDGCEYHCVYQGAEICNTGVDENCDGEYNTEDSVGCTTYYNDGDNDTFGIDGDWHCYCSPVGTYRATQEGDCDDTNSAVNPNALEACDGLDNDCVGGVDNGLGSTTCGLGVCDNTINNCIGGVT